MSQMNGKIINVAKTLWIEVINLNKKYVHNDEIE
jgi:hypothetical protein